MRRHVSALAVGHLQEARKTLQVIWNVKLKPADHKTCLNVGLYIKTNNLHIQSIYECKSSLLHFSAIDAIFRNQPTPQTFQFKPHSDRPPKHVAAKIACFYILCSCTFVTIKGIQYCKEWTLWECNTCVAAQQCAWDAVMSTGHCC